MLQFHLEAGYMLYYYYEPSDSKEQFTQARKRASITAQLTGKAGTALSEGNDYTAYMDYMDLAVGCP